MAYAEAPRGDVILMPKYLGPPLIDLIILPLLVNRVQDPLDPAALNFHVVLAHFKRHPVSLGVKS